MSDLEFDELIEQLQQHFVDQTYAEGLTLGDEYLEIYPEERANINYLRLCLAVRLGQSGMANQILNATLSSGVWYSETVLRQSPALKDLQGNDIFEKLVDVSLKMQANDPANALPVLVIRPEDECEPGYDSCPALIFLHGNTDNPQSNLSEWASLPSKGWLLALPRSSQAMWVDAYAWLEVESASQEVFEHYEKLTMQYSIDEENIILAGSSMGGEVALSMALDGKIPARGFILVGPGGPFMDSLENWSPLIDAAQGRDLRGLIVMGEADKTIPQNNIRILVDQLNQSGIKTNLRTYPGLKHEYPDNFEEVLKEAVSFIMD